MEDNRPYQNRIKTLESEPAGLSAERKQTPQIVEKPRNRIGLKEGLEAVNVPPKYPIRRCGIRSTGDYIGRYDKNPLPFVWVRQQPPHSQTVTVYVAKHFYAGCHHFGTKPG